VGSSCLEGGEGFEEQQEDSREKKGGARIKGEKGEYFKVWKTIGTLSTYFLGKTIEGSLAKGGGHGQKGVWSIQKHTVVGSRGFQPVQKSFGGELRRGKLKKRTINRKKPVLKISEEIGAHPQHLTCFVGWGGGGGGGGGGGVVEGVLFGGVFGGGVGGGGGGGVGGGGGGGVV